MTKYIILAYPNNHFIKKALICAEYGGIADQISENKNFKMGVDNKTEEFLKIAPTGKVPALKVDGTDSGLFESNAIASFIARVGNDAPGLLGVDALEQSKVDAWLDFANYYVEKDSFALCAFAFGYGKYDATKAEAARQIQRSAWGQMEGHLKRHNLKFLVKDRVTLADIVIATLLAPLVNISLDQEFRSEFPVVEEYLKRLFEQEQIKKHLGQLCNFKDKFIPPSE